jgi:hypothetical protein
MRSMSCFCRKRETTSGPKVKLTPLSFSLHPVMSLSGSDHRRSQRRPQSGICICQHLRSSDFALLTPLFTYVSRSHNTPDLLHGVEVWAETTVHGEDLLVDDGGNGQAVEAVGEGLPELDVISPFALVVESVDAVDRGALVVSTQDEEVLGVLDLVRKQEADGLERLLATVDVVA